MPHPATTKTDTLKARPTKKARAALRETDLYPAVKRLLEQQGFVVKSEVTDADVVGMKDDDPPIVVELKTRFSLALIHQAIARQKITDTVYVAIPTGSGPRFNAALADNLQLCRRLGLGLMTVNVARGTAKPRLDPKPYHPRGSRKRKSRLLHEFARRVGDPNQGGVNRAPLITAYRQDALRCLRVLDENGPMQVADIVKATHVPKAGRILGDDHYGWFERVARGVYTLTPKGEQARELFADVLTALEETSQPVGAQGPL
ncbi:MAG: DUF2161 family putative PD-(D/E)XK-type phosphodiesterase [Pseudomonadota bacterium]